MSARQLKYIDLCSGIGGFRTAIENYSAGQTKLQFKCILSADIKQDAIDTYNVNFNEQNTAVDINNIVPADLETFDLLCAGFPCQPFSSAGQKKGFDDNRGGIIFKIVDLCKAHKPATIILENVYNLITLNGGKCIQDIKALFENLGYFVDYKKLNSSDFGCPQSRERVYIVCSLQKQVKLDDIRFNGKQQVMKDIMEFNDKRTDIDVSFAETLLQLHSKSSVYGCKIGDKRGGKNNIHSWDIGYNGIINGEECNLMKTIMLERRKKHWAEKKGIAWMDGMPLTYEEILTFYSHANLKPMLDNLVEKKYLKIEKCKDLVNNQRVYKEDSKEGYNICKGKLSFPVSKILNPNDISPTLTATCASRPRPAISPPCSMACSTRSRVCSPTSTPVTCPDCSFATVSAANLTQAAEL